MVESAQHRVGQQIVKNLPTPQKKPFTPNVDPISPESIEYGLTYGTPPHELGDIIRKNILTMQNEGSFEPLTGPMHHRPMAQLGSLGFPPTRILPIPADLNVGGSYYPPNARVDPYYNEPAYDTRNILGENQRLIDDFITYTPEGAGNTVKHEFTHRAFRKLEDIMAETKGRMPPRFSLDKKVKFWNEHSSGDRSVYLNEEDVVKLLDYLSGDRTELPEDYFSKHGKWEHYKTHPEELLASEDVQNLISIIQKMAIEELRKEGIEVPIHYESGTKYDPEFMGGVTIPIE